MDREKDLMETGWERRGIYDEPRLTEIAGMYTELGFQVRLMSIIPDLVAGCSQCMQQEPERYQVLYVRKQEAGSGSIVQP